MLRARTPAVRTADVPIRSGYQEKCCFEDTSDVPCELAAGEDARCPDRGRPRPQRLQQGDRVGKFRRTSSVIAAA